MLREEALLTTLLLDNDMQRQLQVKFGFWASAA
jgi:hypothetical protein